MCPRIESDRRTSPQHRSHRAVTARRARPIGAGTLDVIDELARRRAEVYRADHSDPTPTPTTISEAATQRHESPVRRPAQSSWFRDYLAGTLRKDLLGSPTCAAPTRPTAAAAHRQPIGEPALHRRSPSELELDDKTVKEHASFSSSCPGRRCQVGGRSRSRSRAPKAYLSTRRLAHLGGRRDVDPHRRRVKDGVQTLALAELFAAVRVAGPTTVPPCSTISATARHSTSSSKQRRRDARIEIRPPPRSTYRTPTLARTPP